MGATFDVAIEGLQEKHDLLLSTEEIEALRHTNEACGWIPGDEIFKRIRQRRVDLKALQQKKVEQEAKDGTRLKEIDRLRKKGFDALEGGQL